MYQFSEVLQNEHAHDLTGLHTPVLHMAHGQTYIPLLLLTMSSLNKVYNNDNIHFMKVPNGVVKQTLDPTQFGNEDKINP